MTHAQLTQQQFGMAPWQPADDTPLWRSARDEFVTADDGRQYVDMVMGFGACLWGHGTVYERVLEHYDAAALAQGLGGQHSTELRERALQRLCEWAAGTWPVDEPIQAGILHTGAEAVEAAVKTALAATGRPRGVAFRHAYHGSFGLAAACTAGDGPRKAFGSLLPGDAVRHLPYGEVPELDERDAFVIVEPVQGAAGATLPPPGFLEGLRRACDHSGTLLIVDSVFIGSGRSGVPIEGAHVRPDIIVLAKAIAGGMMGSVVLTRASIAEAAWSGDDAPSLGTTYYGHPFSCAAILEVLDMLDEHDLTGLCAPIERAVQTIATTTGLSCRGKGAMQALVGEHDIAPKLQQRLLAEGFIVNPSGVDNEVLLLTPSLLMSADSLDRFVKAVCRVA